MFFHTTKRRVKASSMGVQIMMTGMIVFTFVLFVDAFYLFSTQQSLQRFANQAANYGLSQSLDYGLIQSSSGTTVMDEADAYSHTSEWAASHINEVCSRDKSCTTNSHSVFSSTSYGMSYIDVSSVGMAIESNPPYSYMNGDIWTTAVPSVLYIVSIDLQVLGVFFTTIPIRVAGEAHLAILDETPPDGYLPWEN